MPDLLHSLQGRDLGHLRIIASLWGVELSAPDARTALPALVKLIQEPSLVVSVVEALAPTAQAALRALLESDGRIPWALFTRRFGVVREMGPGRRDRDKPHLASTSPAEILWYRALIGRAFLKSGPEPLEFAYIPAEFIPWLPGLRGDLPEPLGRAASPAETAHLLPAQDLILDEACTLLAALRLISRQPSTTSQLPTLQIGSLLAGRSQSVPWETLQALLASAGLVDSANIPVPEPTRNFLATSRAEALALLGRAWIESSTFNELWQVPSLVCDGEWRNDPQPARRFLLDLLSQLSPQVWWNIPSFINGIQQAHPDFQRPAGDYDSWLVRRRSDGSFLHGAEHWDEVDGALLRYLITGPLHWLGMLDLAAPAESEAPAAFRYSPWAEALLQGLPPQGLVQEEAPLVVKANGELLLPRLVPRSVRYQVARYCEWGDESPTQYQYRITVISLERARAQGLRTSALINLLRRHAKAPPTPSLVQAIERWDLNGTQAALERVYILRVTQPEILTTLRRSPAARFLGDPLSPTSVIVKASAINKVLAALADQGYLVEAKIE